MQECSDYILSIKNNRAFYSNGEINSIIYEETSAFFSGNKTAEEVAGTIQNRVTTYMNENS